MGNNNSKQADPLTEKEYNKRHSDLNKWLAFGLFIIALKFGKPMEFAKRVFDAALKFPFHYHSTFNWKKEPMSKFIASGLCLVGNYALAKTYYVERAAVDNAHKKYKAHETNKYAVAHGIGSFVEMNIGALACMYPKKLILTWISLLVAVHNVLTGLVITPGVFGIKHLTVPGFYLFAYLRATEILRTLLKPTEYANAYIFLHVGTLVRLLGYWVLPYSSTDGVRGDLFTEPSIYAFNILMSGTITAGFVVPPKWVLSQLILYILYKRKVPPRISKRRLLRHNQKKSESDSNGVVPVNKQV